MLIRSPLLTWVAFTFLALDAADCQEVAPPQDSDAGPLVSALEIEVLPEARSEETDDRVVAKALVAQARMLQQRRDYIGALRRLERAYRYDPTQPTVLRDIVTLATDNKRLDEAARYAALADDNSLSDLFVLRRLAVHASSKRDWKLAIRLYEASLRRQEKQNEREATYVLMKAELARLYFLTDSFTAAHEAFQIVRAALREPEKYRLSDSMVKVVLGDSKDTYSLMTRVAIEAKQFDAASELIELNHQTSPESTTAKTDFARLAVAKEDWGSAEKLLDEILSRGDLANKVPIDLMRRVLREKVPPESLEQALVDKLSPALEKFPDNEVIRAALVEVKLTQGDLASAGRLLDTALKNSVELQRLKLRLHHKQASPADWLETATRISTGSPDELGEEFDRVVADEAFAELVIQAAEQAEDSPPGEKRIAAAVALKRKQLERAQRLFEASLPSEDVAKAELLVVAGLRLLQEDFYEASAAMFRRVIDEKLYGRERSNLYFYLAGALILLDKTDEALAAAHRAVELENREPRYLMREAWILQKSERLAEAVKIYDALIKKFNASSDSKDREVVREARLVASNLEQKLGNEKTAVEHLEQVLDEFPEDVGASNDLAYLWSEQGVHLKRSLAMVEKALVVEPGNRAFRDTRGWILVRLGQIEEAIQELETAAGENADGVVLDHLGDAYSRAGRADDAKTAWRKSVDAYTREGNSTKADSVRQKIKD